MDKLQIRGGVPLDGEVRISGGSNSSSIGGLPSARLTIDSASGTASVANPSASAANDSASVRSPSRRISQPASPAYSTAIASAVKSLTTTSVSSCRRAVLPKLR